MALITIQQSSQLIEVSPIDRTTSVVLAGPIGPPGIPGDGSGSSDVALHNQAQVVHTNATSGRDFSALFQNGLI